MPAILKETWGSLRASSGRLAATSLAYKTLSFIVLTPLASLVGRICLGLSGNAVLTDQDVLLFLLRPWGWLTAIISGALWGGLILLEIAALLLVLHDGEQHRLSSSAAIRSALSRSSHVFPMTARLVLLTAASLAPFLLGAWLVYWSLLSEHDINFYLSDRPPAFYWAVALGSAILLGIIGTLALLAIQWLLALPILLFEGVAPVEAMRVSRQRALGRRAAILGHLVGWVTGVNLVSSIGGALVIGSFRWIIPKFAGSIFLLTAASGAAVLCWALVQLVLAILSTTTLSALIYQTYLAVGGRPDETSSDAGERRPLPPGRWVAWINGRRLVAAGCVAFAASATIGGIVLQSVRLNDDVVIIAHRGSPTKAPENTLAAIRQAIEDGADYVEIDVQETADGHVVVFHDSDFMKLAGDPLKIWDATLEDVERLDIGSWFDERFQAERAPTLSEVLEACKGKAKVLIELKYYGRDEDLEQRVVDIVDSHEMLPNTAAMSLNAKAVAKVKVIQSDWRVGQLLSVSAGDPSRMDVDFLAINASFATRTFVRNAHRNNKEVFVWTVNTPTAMSRAIGLGVDGLITDEPTLAREVLEQRSQMSVPQRLLVELAGLFGVPTGVAEQ